MSVNESSVKVGIVGLGNIGHLHADLVQEHGHELVGGVDVATDARARFAEKYAIETYEQTEELLQTGVEAVIVTTPNKYHEECTVDALEAGCDVLLEKPLAHTLESAERIVETAQSGPSFCMVGFHNRFSKPVEIVKEYQNQGRFGEMRHIEANYIRRRGIPGRGSWFTSQEIAGGGALIDIGVHALDLALHLHDFPEVLEVCGTTRSEFGGRDEYTYLEMWGDDEESAEFTVDDSASAFIRCADGKTITLEVAWATNRKPNEEFILRGTEAGATFDRSEEKLTIHETSSTATDHFSDTEVSINHEDAKRAEQEAFFQAVKAGTPPVRNTASQALEVQRVLAAIYESSKKGSSVKLPSQQLVPTP